MNQNDLETIRACLNVNGPHADVRGPMFQRLLEMVERDRVRAVLDGWAHEGGFRWACEHNGKCWVVQLCTFLEGSDEPVHIEGTTPDAARAAAARAIENGEV